MIDAETIAKIIAKLTRFCVVIRLVTSAARVCGTVMNKVPILFSCPGLPGTITDW